jgi:DeoR/GlpR family transcriptional regulator of sugar metabolism
LGKVHRLVTDKRAPEEFTNTLRKKGVQVLIG